MARPLVAFLGGCIAVGVLHNAIALRMVLETDTRGAAFDPVLNSVAHILLYLLGTFLVVCNFLSLYCVYSALVAIAIVFLGVYQPARHWIVAGDPHQAFTVTAYPCTILIHLFIAQAYVYSFWPCFKANQSGVWKTVQVLVAVLVLVVSMLVPFGGLHGQSCNDQPYFDMASNAAVHRPTHFASQYLTMRDGVKLAVDVHFPDSWKRDGDDSPLPTLILQTRYNRNRVLHFPFNYIGLFGDVPRATFTVTFAKFIRTFVPAGYVVVAVDVRGTGASYGNRTTDLSSVEVDDYKEVLDWVRQQHWYNGRVGAAGVSYDGLAAGLLASHGGVDAVGMMFSPIQFTEDLLAPGGVLSTAFLRTYTIFTRAHEQDRRVTPEEFPLTFSFSFFFRYVFGKVVAIPGHDKSEAVAQHSANWDVVEKIGDFDGFASTMKVTDGAKEVPVGSVGFTDAVFAKLAQSNVSITTYAGYWDHASFRSSLRLHQEVGGSGRVRVVAGPWAHGGLTCFTPHSPGHGTSFPLHQDLLHFFDCHLKGKCDALQRHKETFHYFRMGDEKWIGSMDFPPQSSTWQTYYMSASNGLISNPISEYEASTISHKVSNRSSSGFASRWNLMGHIMRYPVTYPDRLEQTDNMLTFTTQPLASDLRVAGSALVNITLEANDGLEQSNMVVFAYLEDIDPLAARIHYVSEAILKLGHDVVERNPAVGSWDSVSRTYTSDNFQEPRGAVLAELSMIPVAYTFARGHLIRLSFAGADSDNFDLSSIKNLASNWKVHIGSAVLKLPVS